MTNIITYDIARYFYTKNIPVIPRLCSRLTRLIYSCEIPYTASIHPTVHFAHKGLGVVIGHDTEIGEGCKILHNVTIGGRSGVRANPILGKNVLVGAGACILGDVKVEDNVSIGANAVVLKDVSANSISVGVPARTINK